MIKGKKNFLFLLFVFLIGICTVGGYGIYLDQSTEQLILFMNFKEYLLYFPDKFEGLIEQLSAANVPAISEHLDRDHGIAVFYPLFPLWFINQASPYIGNLIWCAYTFILAFTGICSLYLLGEEIFKSKRCAAIMTLLFFLSPRMFAEVHYNNKDVILLCLCFSIFYWGWRLKEQISFKNVFMLAFIGALATNLKIIGAFFFGVIGIYVLACYILTKNCTLKVWKNVILCIVLYFAIFVIITPACWHDITGFFVYLYENAVNYYRWNDYVLFDGRHIHHQYTGIPRKYLPTMILITTPLCILVMSVLGYFGVLASVIKTKGKALTEREGFILVSALAVGIPLLVGILKATPVYNGWRHFYFAYAAFVLGAGYCYYRLEKRIGRLSWQLAYIYIGILAIGIAINYPQEHSYFNVLAEDNVESQFDMDYWDLSTREALEWVLDETDNPSVGALNNATMWGINDTVYSSPEKIKGRFDIKGNWEDAEYVIVNPGYAYLYSAEQYQYLKDNYTMVYQIKSYGNVINEIYQK